VRWLARARSRVTAPDHISVQARIYRALCGQLVLPGSLASPPGSPCPGRLAVLTPLPSRGRVSQSDRAGHWVRTARRALGQDAGAGDSASLADERRNMLPSGRCRPGLVVSRLPHRRSMGRMVSSACASAACPRCRRRAGSGGARTVTSTPVRRSTPVSAGARIPTGAAPSGWTTRPGEQRKAPASRVRTSRCRSAGTGSSGACTASRIRCSPPTAVLTAGGRWGRGADSLRAHQP
jgi:hypothetical protein